MYGVKKAERKILVKAPYNYNPDNINILEIESDKARKGIPIDFEVAIAVCNYQSDLQKIRKRKKWWRFWGRT